MIEISEAASAKVKELLEEQGKADHALRVFVRGMSCSGPAYGMALDNEPRPDDQVAEVNGVKVLEYSCGSETVNSGRIRHGPYGSTARA